MLVVESIMTTNCREFNGYVEFRVSGIVVEMVLWNLIEMVFIVSGVVVGICQRGEIRGIVLKFNGFVEFNPHMKFARKDVALVCVNIDETRSASAWSRVTCL